MNRGLSRGLSCTLALAAAPWAERSTDSAVVLPVVNVTGAHLSKASPWRKDLQAQSLENPYRVESTAEAGSQTMSREDIAALAPKDVIDLLDKASGLNVTYQGRRSPFFVDERGGGNLTYILDGAVLPTQCNRILQSIPVEAIEEVKIVRGSTSLALGPSIPLASSSPLGPTASGSGINTGFVIIRTRRPQATELRAATYAEKAVSQPVARGLGAYAGSSYEDTANGSGLFLAGTISHDDMPSKDSWYDGRNSDAYLLTGGFHYGKFALTGNGYLSRARFEMQRGVTFSGALDTCMWAYDPLTTVVLSSNGTMSWSPNEVTLLDLYYTKYEQNEIDASSKSAIATTRYYSEKTGGASLRHNLRLGSTLFQLGGEYIWGRGFGPNTNQVYNNWEVEVYGFSGTVEQKLWKDQITLDAGYRQDAKHIDRSANKASLLAADSNVTLAPSHVVTAGASWNPGILNLSVRGFGGYEGASGDFDLKTKKGVALHAEKQGRVEASLEGTVLPYARPMVTWFLVDIENQKAASADTYSVDGETYYYYSETDSRRQGLEFQVNGDFGQIMSYGICWTHMLVNESDSSGITTDNNGALYPENTVTGRISARWHGWRLNFTAKEVGAWNSSVSAMGKVINVGLGDYLRLDANVAKDFRMGKSYFTAELYGRNLLNDHYSSRYTTGYYKDRGLTVGTRLSVGI